SWIVRAHASQPETIFLRAVVNGKLALLDKLLPLARGETHRVSVTLQVEEQLGSVLVFPLTRVHRPAPQADDDRDVLNPHRTLFLAGPAGRALECGLFGNM